MGHGCVSPESGGVVNFLSSTNFDLWYSCSLLTYKERKVPYLKDLIHICLETEVEGCSITFNMNYGGSSYFKIWWFTYFSKHYLMHEKIQMEYYWKFTFKEKQ